jgi:putative flippase GtrA
MLSRELIARLGRFAVVGGTVAGSFMALNWLFERMVGKQAAFFLAYPPSVLLHFCLNKWWTFGCRGGDTRRQVGEYLLMVAVAFVIQWGVFKALSALTGWPGWLEAGLANVAQMALTFVVMQRRIFGTRPVPSIPPP